MSQQRDDLEAVSLCSHPKSHNSDEEAGQRKLELDRHTHSSDKRSWLQALLFQTACFLWLLPVAALLTLNFQEYIVGASAWCPGRDCYVGWFNPVRSVPLQNLRSFDRRNHNLLGALQFACKALEIWFELIAVALVYLITFLIAGRKDGLPIGYLTRSSEFVDLPGLLDPLLWKTLLSISRSRDNAGSKAYRMRVYIFIAFTILLCILCNLMGPATAVLALPSLQWIETPRTGNRTFAALGSKDRPSADGLGPLRDSYCTEIDFDNLSFSCAATLLDSKLDSWIESYLASGDYYTTGVSQEQGVRFSANYTFSASSSNVMNQQYSDFTWWAPNRQVLSNLNDDYVMIKAISQGNDPEYIKNVTEPWGLDPLDTYAEYNRSAQMAIQRNGPILGTIVQYHIDHDGNSTWTTIIDNNRSINCYSAYDFADTPLAYNMSTGNYTKCVRIGGGWSAENKMVGFTLRGAQNYTTETNTPDVEVKVLSSDKARFFRDGALPAWLPHVCLQPGQLPSTVACDWDRLFQVEANNDTYNRTRNVVTIEMITRENNTNGATMVKLSVDFVAFLNFTTYQLDPSPISNPTILVQTQDLPKTGDIIQVDPAWVLAAWCVDNNGVLEPDRTAAIEMTQSMAGSLRYDDDAAQYIEYMFLLPVIETLTLIDFTTNASVPSGNGRRDSDFRNPLLVRNARLYVWAYGLGSRTSKLGLVVVLCGVAVVMVQLVLGFVDRRMYRSPTQLLVAALEHAPSHEFKDVEHDEAKMASMRFYVKGTTTNAGKYHFKKMVADK